jgi:uncharacterized membrane protein
MSTIEQSVEVNVPVTTAYNQWTQFEEFPHFMHTVTEVRQLDDTRLHWAAEVGGHHHEWDALISEQKPDERITWRNTDGKQNARVVTFHRIDDSTTRLMVQLDYLPEGLLEKAAAALGAPDRRVKDDLERFKEFIEEHRRPTGAFRGEIEQPRVG